MKLLITLFLLCCSYASCLAQDVIVKRNGDEVQARVMEVSPLEVRYREFNKPEGAVYIIPRADIFMIKYQNGSKDVFNEPLPAAAAPQTEPSGRPAPQPMAPVPAAGSGSRSDAQAMYMKGIDEARVYYKGNGTLWGTAAATFLFLPAGLVVGGVSAIIPPNVDNQLVSDRSLLYNQDFRSGYRKQAHRRKVGKAAAGFGIGFAALLVLLSISSQ